MEMLDSDFRCKWTQIHSWWHNLRQDGSLRDEHGSDSEQKCPYPKVLCFFFMTAGGEEEEQKELKGKH